MSAHTDFQKKWKRGKSGEKWIIDITRSREWGEGALVTDRGIWYFATGALVLKCIKSVLKCTDQPRIINTIGF